MNSPIQEVMEVLKSHGDEDYAVRMKSYLKDHFELYGIQSPKRKLLTKSFMKSHKKTDYQNIKSMVKDLWEYPFRDVQYVAMDLFSSYLKTMEKEDLSLLEYLITSKSWWDTADWLAAHGAGTYFMKFPDVKMEVIEKWMQSENLWLIRSGIIHQLFYKEKTDFDLMVALILDQKGSKEFFINKASGWALRQYSKTNPSMVQLFIDEYSSELSNLTIKEGMKWIVKNR